MFKIMQVEKVEFTLFLNEKYIELDGKYERNIYFQKELCNPLREL